MTTRQTAVLHVLTCVALWALIPVVSKTGQADLDSHQFLFWSSVVSFLALGGTSLAVSRRGRGAKPGKKPHAGTGLDRGKALRGSRKATSSPGTDIPGSKNSLHNWRARDWAAAVVLGFLGTYLYYILLYFGYAEARGLEVLVLQYSWPVFVALFGIILFREKLSWRRGLAILLGFAGVLLVLTKGDFTDIHLDNARVDLWVIIGALAFGLFSVLSKKLTLEPFALNTVYFLTAAVASFLSMMLFSEFSWPGSGSILPILVNGVFVNGFSYIFWLSALRKADASFVAPFVFLTPVLSAVYLVLFFGEALLPVYLLGLGTVIAGGLLNRE